MDLAKQAEGGVNVDWHLHDAVASTLDELAVQFNADDLLQAYVQGLETLVHDAGPARKAYAGALRTATDIASRGLRARG